MLAIAAESSLPAARLHRARADSRRGSGASSAEYKHRARRGPRRSAFGKSAPAERLASDAGFYLFDGIDHPLRIKQGATIAYYEIDLAFNVRRLRASGGVDLGGYRYTAFGQTKTDTTTLAQQLRWKGRWASAVAGGIYDVRARQWAPELGVFLSIDEYEFHDMKSTLWGWPRQNPMAFADPQGRGKFCFPLNPFITICISWPDKPPSPPPSPPPTPPPPGPAPGECKKPPPPPPQPLECRYPCSPNDKEISCADCCAFYGSDCKSECCGSYR